MGFQRFDEGTISNKNKGSKKCVLAITKSAKLYALIEKGIFCEYNSIGL